MKHSTGRHTIDIGDHKQKSTYEIYVEQTTVEEMERFGRLFKRAPKTRR